MPFNVILHFLCTCKYDKCNIITTKSFNVASFSGYLKQKENIMRCWNLTRIPRKNWTRRPWTCRNRQFWGARERPFVLLTLSRSLFLRSSLVKVALRAHPSLLRRLWMAPVQHQFHALEEGSCPPKKAKGYCVRKE